MFEFLTLKNVWLTKGLCAVCKNPIDQEWNHHPDLGDKCRTCLVQRDVHVFGPRNVRIKAEKTEVYDPLFGIHNYRFKWKGSKVKINYLVHVLAEIYGTGSKVLLFGINREGFRTQVEGLGYRDLLRIYAEQGGQAKPTPVNFGEYTPQSVTLLEKPILPVLIERDGRSGLIRYIHSGERHDPHPPKPMYEMLHAFCNMFVRYKFGLMRYYKSEGGFLGRGFQVRNADVFNSRVLPGLTVEYSSYLQQHLWADSSAEEISALASSQAAVNVSLQFEEKKAIETRGNVVELNPPVEQVLIAWTSLMETLG